MVNEFFAIYQNYNIKKNLPQDYYINSLFDAEKELIYLKKLFYDKSGIFWAILKHKILIGTIGFNSINFDTKVGEIGLDLQYEYWGQGIMFSSLVSIINYIKSIKIIKYIDAYIQTDNINSIKLFEKCNFTKKSFLPQYGIRDGILKDFYHYQLILN